MSVAEFTEFEKVIQGILSTDNDVRKQAEAIYRKCANNGDKFFTYSVHLLNSGKNPDVRVFCAVMIRQYLSLSNKLWEKVSSTVKELVKAMLLDLFKREENRSMRKKVSNAIGAVAAKAFSSEEKWDVLLPTLIEVWKSPHALHRESVLDIMDVLGEFCVETLRPHLGGIKGILGQGLTDTKDSTISIAALRATVSLIISLEDEERGKMVDCVPLMFQCLATAYKNKDNEDPMKDILETLVNLARCQPTFLRKDLKTILGFVIQMAVDKELDSETRRLAMEFLLTIAETGKGMVRKIPEYAKNVIPAALAFMTDLEHTEEWNSGEDEDDSEQQNYLMGLESVERLSFTLGGKIFLSVVWEIIEKFVKGEWVNKHAAMMCISKMCTGCEKVLEKDIEKVLKVVVPMLSEKHPRVQWAAINTIAQLSVDITDFQKKYHSGVIPALCQGMNPSLNPRVVRHATLSIVDFANGSEPAYILPYVNAIFAHLLKLLSVPNLKIQQAALSCLTAITLVIEKEFVKYYGGFLPGIKAILKDAREEKHKELRGKAMECIGVIAKAVGKDVFAAEAPAILKILVDTQKEGLGGDDPQYTYLVMALSRICQCMGPAFLPYLQYVIPPLLKSASISDAFMIDDGVEPGKSEEKEGYETVSVAIRHFGNKRITINTSLLEEQATACHALYEYAHELKEHFFPYVGPTANALVPLVAYPYNENVRVAASLAVPALLTCTALHLKKAGQDPSLLWKMWTGILPQYITAMAKEIHLDALTGLVESLKNAVKALSAPLPEKQLEQINAVIKELVLACCERREKREELKKSPDFDEQEKDLMEEENDEEDKFLSQIYYLIAVLVKGGKDSYAPSFHKSLFPIFWGMLAPEKSVGEHIAGLCTIDDLIAYGGAPGAQYITKFLPVAFGYSKDPDSDVRQSAVWGIGACAQASKEKFLPVCETALDVLSKVITAKDSKTEENEAATDNAIGAVAKICRHTLTVKGQEKQLAKVLPTLLQWLPIKGDYEEGQDIHDLLCDFIESNNPALQMEKNLPRILSIFGSIIGTNAVTEATTVRIAKIWKVLCSSVPSSIMASAVGLIKSEEQEKLKKLSAEKS